MMAHGSARRGLLARVADRLSSPSDFLLAARMVGWAVVLPAVKHVVPLRTLVRIVQRSGDGGARSPEREDQIVTLARWSCRLTRWPGAGNCLERGLLAYRFLGAVNANPRLVVGIARSDRGDVSGHAWVLVDGKPAGEAEDAVADFTRVVTFRADGSFADPSE
jgi:hypothetical protein